MTAQVSKLSGTRRPSFTLLNLPDADTPIAEPEKNVVLGFFLPLAASGGLVMVQENINGGVRGVEALESITPVPILAAIPHSVDEEIVERNG
jgi:capsular polysaccharide biosynthesis protein